MMKRYAAVVHVSLFALDLAVTVGAFLAAWLLFRSVGLPDGIGGLGELGSYLWLLLFIVPLWAVLLQGSDIYETQRTAPLSRELWGIVQAVGFGAVGLLAFLAAAKIDHVSRPFMAAFVVIDGAVLAATHLAIRLAARRARRRGRNTRAAAIVGTGPAAQAVAERLASNPHWGFRLVGVVAERPGMPSPDAAAPLLGSVRDLPRILCEYVVDEVFVAVDRERMADMETVFTHCERVGVTARLVVDFFPRRVAKVELDDLDGLPTMAFTTTPRDAWGLAAKRAIDLAGSGLFLLAFSWLYGLIALAVKLGSRGPVLYRQERVGMNGRRFRMLKFRSMVADAERRQSELSHLNEMDGPVFKIAGDPRITRIGRVLRKFSLDELPQMWNVLVGEMSLVGPRPPVPSEVQQYDDVQRRRLSVRPGLTCLWQISGRNRVNFQKWVELDLQYIDTWSLALDLKILARTVPAVLSGKGAS